jgi:hypothetical protein
MLGSTREHMQQWHFDLTSKTAYQLMSGFRQVRPTAAKLTTAEMTRIAKGICEAIQDGPKSSLESATRLTWSGESEFRVKPSSLIPLGEFNRTRQGRRRRMTAVLQTEIEAIGWMLVTQTGGWLVFRKAEMPPRVRKSL